MFMKTNISFDENSTDTRENGPASDSISLNSFKGIFILCFYIVVFAASCVGNIVVLHICRRTGRSAAFRPTSTGFFNRYIATLAIADLLFTQLTVFDAIYVVLGEWTMGAVICKLQGFFVELCYSASILTLMAISRERLKSLSDLAMKSRIQQIKTRKRFSVIVWVVAILLCSPLLYAYSLETIPERGIKRCRNTAWSHIGRRIYYSLMAVILFVFPLVMMIWTQLKIKRVFKSQVGPNQQIQALMRARQKKARRILSAVTLAFFAFWSPFILTRTLRYFSWYEGDILWRLSQLLTIASAAANPFIYSFYSLHFRAYIKRFITCRCGLMAASAVNLESSIGNTLF